MPLVVPKKLCRGSRPHYRAGKSNDSAGQYLNAKYFLRNNAVFINDDWVVSPWWRVNAGLRQDAHSTFGTADTYKVVPHFRLAIAVYLKHHMAPRFGHLP